MAEHTPNEAGRIVWVDLTVQQAEEVRDFYKDVVGWTVAPVAMDGYDDYGMASASGEPVAGVCHARGCNADLPPQWLIYVTVDDLDRSMSRCQEMGGSVVSGPRSMGSFGRFCVVRDPAGAVCGLIEPPAEGGESESG